MAPRVDLLDRGGEVVGKDGGRPQVVIGKCIDQKFFILLKAVQVRPGKDTDALYEMLSLKGVMRAQLLTVSELLLKSKAPVC